MPSTYCVRSCMTRNLFAIAKFLLMIGRLLLHCWCSLGRPVTIGTPMVIFAVLTVFWLFLVHCCYTVGGVLVDTWRLVHQWSFLCCFDCFWRLVHCWYSLGRHVTIGTPMVIFAVLTVFWLLLTIGTPLVHCWCSLGRPVTIGTPMVLSVFDDWYSVPFVKDSQKTVKTAKITIGVPIVTCLHRVRRIHKAAQTPLPCETSITCAWAVATARHPWAGLTVSVYMDVHAFGSRSLPRAATLSSTYYWWCLQLV